MGRIVRDHDELAKILRVFRNQGKSVVFTNGCFDLLHVGHIRCLIDAASRGHYLVVGLNSDAAVRSLKGDDRPLQPEMERAEIVSAIEGVDYVTIFEEDTADNVLRSLRPTAVAKGPEYKLKDLPEADTLAEIGAELLSVGDPKSHSTSELLGKIQTKNSRNGAKARKSAPAKKPSTAKAKSKASRKSTTKKVAAKKSVVKKATGKKASKKSSGKKTTSKKAGKKGPARRATA